ncbi:low molecular weight protein-tyrosine-phosphatase [Pokkaliibacter sp. CJK22405]|uniref:low molecular weight protein-tyrosine-phosphatase n=1 Tax=Pokkaliibacter sp. CJK22405 TaxID=3384615 RepID=UPI0039849010
MFNNILVVCVGNICRSPVGEILLRETLPNNFNISSAGIAALTGKPIDPTSAELLTENGIDSSAHIAQQLNSDLISKNDLILVMEKGHIDAICSRYPSARGKVQLLGRWQGDVEIPDPYRQQRPAFEHAYKLIAQGVADWAKKLGC